MIDSILRETDFPRESGRPLADEVADAIAKLIETGRLAAGQRLPDTASVAGFLGVSRQVAQDAHVHAGTPHAGARPVPCGGVREAVAACRCRSSVTPWGRGGAAGDRLRLDTGLFTRNFYTSSSCGVCGKASIEAVEVRGCPVLPSGEPVLHPRVLDDLPRRLRRNQPVFERTGGLHAAGLFDTLGNLRVLREDVGRHNAVDKVVGHGLLEGVLPYSDGILVVSGRTSFEIIQKALMAGIPAVVAVGAPSSLAVDLAREFNQTLVGFARGGGFNVYAGKKRVQEWEKEEG